MADIFVSYARMDKARVAPLVAAIEAQGWSVWWDPAITPGQEFDRQISAELDAAKAVIVVWSPLSVDSRWVRGEAREAADRGVLVPVRFGQARLPIDARAMHTADLDDWREDQASLAFQELKRALRALIGESTSAAPGRTVRPVARTASGRSICVLPFVNMSGDPEQEYFSDGLSEELLNQLAQMKDLKVAARTSCFAFKGQTPDLRIVGEKLGVAHVLEGSVRKSGNRLRITAQLITVADGYHLWSNTFNRELDDVFAIQEDIARAVADALKITLGMNESTLPAGVTRNVAAYDLYLRAQAMARQPSLPAIRRAIDLFREAVQLDPGFMLAWLGLAGGYSLEMIFAPESSEESRRMLGEALDRAEACSPDDVTAQAVQGTHRFLERDWLGADRAYEMALRLAPSAISVASRDVGGSGYPFFLACTGRIAESLDQYGLMIRSDPLASMEIYQQILDCAARFEEAETNYRRSMRLPIDTALAEYFALLRAMARAEVASVKAQFQRYLALKHEYLPIHGEVLAHFDDQPFVLALVRAAFDQPVYQHHSRMVGLSHLAAYFGDDTLALDCLRRGLVDMRGVTVSTIWHPLFARMHRTDGFKKLVRDLGLYDYWRQSGHWADIVKPRGADDFEVVGAAAVPGSPSATAGEA
jgi:adenylate cyclase